MSGAVLTPLKLVLGLVGVFWMFLAGIAYVVYLPAGWPNYPRFGLWAFHAPWAGAVQGERAKAAWNAAQWSQCRKNEGALQSAITAQNASLGRLADAGSRATAEAARAVQQAQKPLATASEARATIAAPVPAVDDVCAAAKVVDGRLLGSLK